jgi:deoxyribonuclease V
MPSIGCAKSRLCGSYRAPSGKAGSLRFLKDKDEIIGRVVQTKNNVKPLFVSVGHRIDLQSAVRWTLRMCRGYRMPEPTRLAHLEVNRFRRQMEEI